MMELKTFYFTTLVTAFIFVSGEKEVCGNKGLKDGSQCHSKDKRPITLQRPSNERSPSFGEKQLPVIIWWYKDPFPHSSTRTEIKCTDGSCLVSNDRDLKDDALVRAYIFYGTSFLASDLPLPRKQHDLWALFHEESPKNNWMFSHDDGISIFNYTATFSRESDYPLATQFIPDLHDWIQSTYFISTEDKNRLKNTEDLASVVFLQRDCNPPSDRDRYVQELMKYIKVDSFGPCLNNKKMPSNIEGFHKLSDDAYYRFLARYKFHISFENAICKDYMTEKLFRPLEIGVVPVYMGSSDARRFMPNNHSAIFVSDFASPKELAKYLKELDNDDSKYNEYLQHHHKGIENDWLIKIIEDRKWRIHGPMDKVNFIHRMHAGLECDLCDLIIKRNKQLIEHKKDNNIPPPKNLIASPSHMDCPEPIISLKSRSHVNISAAFWEGFHEAKALKEMLLANETNSKNFVPQYLKTKTDKYL